MHLALKYIEAMLLSTFYEACNPNGAMIIPNLRIWVLGFQLTLAKYLSIILK